MNRNKNTCGHGRCKGGFGPGRRDFGGGKLKEKIYTRYSEVGFTTKKKRSRSLEK